MVTNITFIIVSQFDPSSFPHVKFYLVEEVLKALLVGKYHILSVIKVMSPNIQSEDYDSKLKIVGSVVDFVFF